MKVHYSIAVAIGSIVITACDAQERAPEQSSTTQPSAMIVAPPFEMRPRPTDEAEFDEYVEYLLKVADPRTPEQIKDDDGIKARFEDTMIVDSLAVGAPGFPAGLTAEMYETGTAHSLEHGYNVATWTVTNGGAALETELSGTDSTPFDLSAK